MQSRALTSSARWRSQVFQTPRMIVSRVHSVPRESQSVSTSVKSTSAEALDFDSTKYRRQGLVFAAQRSDTGCDSWQMPQGGIDDDESPEIAALRELHEETCIRPTSVTIVKSIDRWLTYDFPTQVRARLHGGWEQYQGQAQKWFLVLFDGDDSEINIDTEHKEFKSWRWMPLEALCEDVVHFKKPVYEQVAATFLPEIAHLKERREVGNGNGSH